MDKKTHYEKLQVTPTACGAVIRSAYKTLSQQHHPDKNLRNIDVAVSTIKEINEAYAVLSNPLRRKEYDRKLERLMQANLAKQAEQKLTSSERSTIINQILRRKMISIFWLSLLGFGSYWVYMKVVWGPSHSYIVSQNKNKNCVYRVNMSEEDKRACEEIDKK